MRPLFASAVFLGSSLLFFIQPLFAKMLLPRVGGAPAVWTTCLVFFQIALLAGYAYAHALPAKVGERRHALVHLGVLAAPLVVMPIAIRTGSPPNDGGDPIGWVLAAAAVSVGAPFLVLSASAPLLQRWFAGTSSEDPYPLFSASNLGSLFGLLGYPLLVEPRIGLAAQGRLFAGAYVVFALLSAACALARVRAPEASPTPIAPATAGSTAARLRWIALAFVPSGLMLGATTHMGEDIAAVPMLWVPPLALYLISFIVVFARPPRAPSVGLRVAFLGLGLGLYLFALPRIAQHFAVVALHLLLVFLGGLLFHGELARSRPQARELTSFYLCVAAGGALGGIFCSLLAPLLFRGVYEYPIVIALAIALLPTPPAAPSEREREAAFLRSLGVDASTVAAPPAAPTSRVRVLDLVVPAIAFVLSMALGRRHPGAPVAFALPLVVCIFLSLGARVRLGAGMLAIVAAGAIEPGALDRERSFFGVLRVEQQGTLRTLFHGTTIHGEQRTDEPRAPLLYYTRTSPIGQLFQALEPSFVGARVAVVGLGAGELATYAEPGQRWTFYEIDAAVERIARRDFTYLHDCRAPADVTLGDARIALARAPAAYRLIVLDAFSSDAIPVHLLTREAFALYRRELEPGGVVVVHISNRYLRLDGVVAAGAADAGLEGWIRRDRPDDPNDPARATWVALARSAADLHGLVDDPGWHSLRDEPRRPWTDDFSDLLGALRVLHR